MSNKYELTANTKQWCGRTLYQIRALQDIEELEVKAGDLGGWIEKIENLSQDGEAWVCGSYLAGKGCC